MLVSSVLYFTSSPLCRVPIPRFEASTSRRSNGGRIHIHTLVIIGFFGHLAPRPFSTSPFPSPSPSPKPNFKLKLKLRTSAAAAAALRGSPPCSVPLALALPTVLPGPPTTGVAFGFEFATSVFEGATCAGMDALLGCGGAAPRVRPGPWKLSDLDSLPQRLPISRQEGCGCWVRGEMGRVARER